MKALDPFEDYMITEEELYEMARIQQANSGIPFIMFASTKLSVNSRHGPRIKISNVKGTFSAIDNFVVTIDHEPQLIAGTCKFKKSDLEDIIDWIKLNYDTLMKYWNNAYDDDVNFYHELVKL